MALTKAEQELVDQIKDEGQRKQMTALLDGNPAVREAFAGNLRQTDYDRKMNEHKAQREKEEAEAAGYRTEHVTWKDWYERQQRIHNETLERSRELQRQNADLTAKVAAASAGTGDQPGVDPATVQATVEKQIQERGYVTKEQLDTIIKQAVEGERSAFFKETLPGVMRFQSTLNNLHWRHRDEFKEPLDEAALMKHMSERKIEDPQRAYDEMVADRRREAEREKIRGEERDKILRERLPGSGPLPAELGVVEALRRGQKLEGLPENVQVGTGALAAAAAAELRAEGKV